MKRKEALKLLGLSNAMAALTPEIVTEAFRNRVKIYHPDIVAVQYARGQVPVCDMDDLTIAKETLLSNLHSDDFTCKLCRGVGKVPAKMGLRTCVACNGTGDRR